MTTSLAGEQPGTVTIASAHIRAIKQSAHQQLGDPLGM